MQGFDLSIVLETKLHPPPARPELIERVGLLRHLVGSEASVVVVGAPAGYGKTVLLSQYAAVAARPFVWLSLDATDADPLLLALEGAGVVLRGRRMQAHEFSAARRLSLRTSRRCAESSRPRTVWQSGDGDAIEDGRPRQEGEPLGASPAATPSPPRPIPI